MPVKLSAESDADDVMVISKAEYETGQKNFTGHYYAPGVITS